MKKYQINITENKDGTVQVDRVCLERDRKPNRTSLKVMDKREFTRLFLNKIETFVTK
jgi:hypothetical protein|tara:strand:- start:2210 stop:2380 length:171 start_codon:yes stop_codon:yes gene_type:complete